MKKLTFILMLAAAALMVQSCAFLMNTSETNYAGNGSPTSDSSSTMGGEGIVGSSNTPGTFRDGTSQGSVAMVATANTTGPSPSPGDLGGNVNTSTTRAKNNSTAVSDYTQWFIVEGALNGTYNYKLTEIALNRSKNTAVKNYTSQIIIEHKAAADDLKTLAALKKVKLPDLSNLGAVNAHHSSSVSNSAPANIDDKISKLTNVPDDQFDRVYVRMMVTDDQETLNFLQQGAGSTDPDVKAYANKYLPILKNRLKKANALK